MALLFYQQQPARIRMNTSAPLCLQHSLQRNSFRCLWVFLCCWEDINTKITYKLKCAKNDATIVQWVTITRKHTKEIKTKYIVVKKKLLCDQAQLTQIILNKPNMFFFLCQVHLVVIVW